MALKRTTKKKNASVPEEAEIPVWEYGGYRLKTNEFIAAMGPIFSAAIQRTNVARQSLDITLNWAVISTGATLSIAFSSPEFHHAIIILNTFLVLGFLVIEAQRYRYFELWNFRARLLELDFYTAMRVPPFHPSPEWVESLAQHLFTPRISLWDAIGHRLRRNYYMIFLVLFVAWFTKVWLFPAPAINLEEFMLRGAFVFIPGQIVTILVLFFYSALALNAILTLRLTRDSDEILARFGDESAADAATEQGKPKGRRAWFVPRNQHNQLLALIITGKGEAVSKRILSDLKRQVAAVKPTEIHTGSDRTVFLCPLAISEAQALKTIVAEEDPLAFVIVSPAQEILDVIRSA